MVAYYLTDIYQRDDVCMSRIFIPHLIFARQIAKKNSFTSSFLSFSATGRRMNTVINLYIGNLALADVIIAVLCIPFQFQAALLHRWDLPAFLCKLCPFVQVSPRLTRLLGLQGISGTLGFQTDHSSRFRRGCPH